MLIIAYDIRDDKLRTKFNKFICKFGYRLQYSVYKIQNSDRILNNISNAIKNKFEPLFDDGDSIMIFDLSKQCKITNYGFVKNEESEFIFL